MLLISINNIHSKCLYGSLYYPYGDTLNSNSLILIDRIYSERDENSLELKNIIHEKYPIFLISGEHKVVLEVIETNQGDVNIFQALLKPKESLKPNKKYELFIENINFDTSYGLLKYSKLKYESVPPSWYVKESNDTTTPKIIAKPKFIDKYSCKLGCGPQVLVSFQLKTNKTNITLVETELKDSNGNIKKFILRLKEDNIVDVGRDMCGGGFEFEYNKAYSVRFKLIDDNGNVGDIWSQWVSFTSPDKPSTNGKYKMY